MNADNTDLKIVCLRTLWLNLESLSTEDLLLKLNKLMVRKGCLRPPQLSSAFNFGS